MLRAIFTVVAKNYLPYARVLMASVRRWAPDLRRFVVLTDRLDGYFDPANEDFEVIFSEDLPIPQSQWFHFKYTVLELSTAVKPFAISYLFERYGCDDIIYLDPDIKLFENLGPVLDRLGSHSFLLTPHLTSPLEDDRCPTELDILRSGAYNLGFIALRACDDSRSFLKWWQARLYDQCVVDLVKGLFVDQRWLDLAPGLFENVGIVRDPAFNVAYWNIDHRHITRSDDKYFVNGAPLRFFHFSGFDPENPSRFSRHQNRFVLSDLGDAKTLVMNYRDELFESGYIECKTWPYAYGSFSNGFPIPDIGRAAHHEAAEVQGIADPFSEDGFRAFVHVWNEPLSVENKKPPRITRLAYRIYKSRSDVQSAMPDIFGADLLRFLKWMTSSGQAEYGLHGALVAPIWDSIRVLEKTREMPELKSDSRRLPSSNEKLVQAIETSRIWIHPDAQAGTDPLTELIDNGAAKLRLSHLAKAIYESRLDLQRCFADPCGRDGVRFLLWFLTYGAHEYRLNDALVRPLREQWNTVVGSLESPVARLWYGAVLKGARHSIQWRRRLSALSHAVRYWQASKIPSRRIVAMQKQAGKEAGASALDLGLNFVGYLRSEMGVGESGRCAIRSARAAGLPISLKSVDAGGPFRLGDRSAGPENGEFPHLFNLFRVNADQVPHVMFRVGPQFVRGKYNIGFWAWELEEFPQRWFKSFTFLDEVWVPSTFNQAAIGRKSPVPVLCMPHSIQVDVPRLMDKSAFGIPADRFVFLAIFDLLSIFERKNPLGVIRAFREAFERDQSCHLVLKINNVRQRRHEMDLIRKACVGLRVTLLDQTMDREDVNALIQCSDCVVSLHRSEGFGLTLAEAMCLGKPVVATAYSGNLDFTTADNAFLVRYKLTSVPPNCEPYDEGLLWADPDLISAVKQMRTVYSRPDLRLSKGAAAKEFVKEHLSPPVVGELMKGRLEMLAHHGRVRRSDAAPAPLITRIRS